MLMSEFETRRAKILAQIEQAHVDPEGLALDVFECQYKYNKVYREFCDNLKVKPKSVNALKNIPFLPISVFKNHKVVTGNWDPVITFKSSGTTGQVPSLHFVRDLQHYHDVCVSSFSHLYGSPEDYTWLALLPSYLERTGSSLVSMVNYFTTLSDRKHGFYLYNFEDLARKLEEAMRDNEKVVLIGVSFALFDFAEKYQIPLTDNIIVMETGGMKGRKEEMTRNELHDSLKVAFNCENIHSEYGMTELIHQFYAPQNGIFHQGTLHRAMVRSINDPLEIETEMANGLLNIFDPGNIDSCSFIATDDIATIHENGSFEILGRSDNSEMRGCNLLYTDKGVITSD